jgi:hypothetical protein
MQWIDAGGVIARVHDQHPLWDFLTIVELIGFSVSTFRFLIVSPDLSVPICVDLGLPLPALIGPADLNLLAKPFC